METEDKVSEESEKNVTESKDKANDSCFSNGENTSGSKSVPAKSWYEMVEEDDEEAARSAPPLSNSGGTAFSLPRQEILPFSLPRQAAETVFSPVSLP